MSLPRWLILGSIVLGVAVVALVWLHPLLTPEDVVAVESIPLEEPKFIDVRVMNKKNLKRFFIHSGECRVKDAASVRGPYDVQTVLLGKNRIWLCADAGTKKPDGGRCTWAQQPVLHCLEPPIVSAPGMDPRRLGRELRFRTHYKRLRITTHVELERYVEDVVMSEHAYAPFETRRVQAIISRTFAAHAVTDPRHDDAPLCDTTHCQAYSTALSAAPDEMAALSTKDLVMLDRSGAIAPTYFHSTCGGQTQSASRVWPGSNSKDIIGVRDLDDSGRAWCRRSSHYRWKVELTPARLARALKKAAGRKLDPRTLVVERLNDAGLKWKIGDRRRRRTVRGAALHRSLGRSLGFSKVKSTDFEIRREGRKFVLEGHGLGHRVGLCQKGAEARAKAGQTAEDILSAYFPRLSVSHLDLLSHPRP